jgi:hypothetical protein
LPGVNHMDAQNGAGKLTFRTFHKGYGMVE